MFVSFQLCSFNRVCYWVLRRFLFICFNDFGDCLISFLTSVFRGGMVKRVLNFSDEDSGVGVFVFF